MKKEFIINGKIFKFPRKGGWYFVKTGKSLSSKLKNVRKFGFGSVRVNAKLGKTPWKTSLFPEKKNGNYMVAIKSSVRKKEGIKKDDRVRVYVSLR